MNIVIKKLSPSARTPTYGTSGAACFDLYASEPRWLRTKDQVIVSTGLAFEIPEGFVMMVYSRSGLAFQKRVSLGNCVGVIDSDYRGEVKVALRNDSVWSHEVAIGDRIAQAMIIPVNQVSFSEGDLSNTERGEGGFGSTGQ